MTAIDQYKKETYERLNGLVQNFNDQLEMFYDHTGCGVTFSFRFNERGQKILALQDILLPVYRSPEGEESLQKVAKAIEDMPPLKIDK